MAADLRALLEGVAYGTDREIRPADRLKAADLLQGTGLAGDTLCSACTSSGCVIRREVEMMDDDDLAAFTAPLLTRSDEIEAYKRHLDQQFEQAVERGHGRLWPRGCRPRTCPPPSQRHGGCRRASRAASWPLGRRRVSSLEQRQDR